MTQPFYTPLDLAACLASRLCHDLISPIGAIVNGFELLEDKTTDSETRAFALDMAQKSARNASAQLQFARMAFGVLGQSGDITIGPQDVKKIATNALETSKIRLSWTAPPTHPLTKHEAKVFLNLLVLATRAIPRGGEIALKFPAAASSSLFVSFEAKGIGARWPLAIKSLGHGYPIPTEEILSVHSVVFFYTHLVAETERLSITVQDMDDSCVSIDVLRT
jgi:histidine phosphotransferase ChpT